MWVSSFKGAFDFMCQTKHFESTRKVFTDQVYLAKIWRQKLWSLLRQLYLAVHLIFKTELSVLFLALFLLWRDFQHYIIRSNIRLCTQREVWTTLQREGELLSVCHWRLKRLHRDSWSSSHNRSRPRLPVLTRAQGKLHPKQPKTYIKRSESWCELISQIVP